MLMIDLCGPVLDDEERDLLGHPQVGGVLLFSRNYEHPRQLAELCDAIRVAAGGACLVAADHEGGRVQRFRDGFTALPPLGEYGRRWNADPADTLEAVRAHGRATARELGERGIDLPFAPVVDLDRGDSEIIGDRAFSASPEVVTALARAYIMGLRDGGMAATLKHFPGHGGVAGDSHTMSPVDARTLTVIEQEDLPPFKAMIDEGVGSVMMAHVSFPEVDPRPASFSPVWIGQVLREEMGFDGAVFCDDISMAGAAGLGAPADRARAALDAGCDMVPVCNDRQGVIRILDSALPPPKGTTRRRLTALAFRAG